MLEITGYELIEKIADGGMAAVWKARQLSLDRIVAIKILDKKSLPDESALMRFRKEAQTAARLNHPNIVQVFDTGEIEGHAYLVMEFVEGQSVGEIIAIHGAVKESRALEIIESTAVALSYAWDKECVIHCDVNPNNILIERGTDHVKVTDLGISRMIGIRRRENEDTDLIVGTPNYTSPEQSSGINDLDCRTDIYSVGATLYHMVTGLLPFHDEKGSGAMTRHEEDYLADPKEVNPELTSQTAWLIEKLMIKNRSLRPLYWTEVIEDIRSAQRGSMPKGPLPESGASTVLRSGKRNAESAGKKVVAAGGGNKPPIKLAVNKSGRPETVSPAVNDDDSAGIALRTTILLFFAAAAVYAGFYYYGRIKGPLEPVVIAEPVLEEPVVNETVSGEEEKQPDSGVWRNEDFITGAKYYNQGLADYNRYQKERSDLDLLTSAGKNFREAIAYFEACKDAAPEGVDVGYYLKASNEMLFNIGQSSSVDLKDKGGAAKVESSAPPQTVKIGDRRKVVFIDDEPEPESVPEPEPENLLMVALNSGWDSQSGGSFGEELVRLLARHTVATDLTDVDPSVMLYPGIMCMMKAKDAARVLESSLPSPRSIDTPGFLTGSLYYYPFEGNFYGARELMLVCDRNDRVIMSQLYDTQPAPAKLNQAFFSPNWTVYDYIAGRTRGPGDGLIAHQVRRANKVIRIDTELAESAGDNQTVKARVVLMMPERLAGMLLQANQGR